ncbi:MAG TPA: hypothetical protein VN732_05755 [Solirubrobacterales bacterium]|nr:hypothetical protein [Solirubrobacterales bacterium]
MWSITDLFLVGLALDVVGAVILAKGLLADPLTIYRLTATYVGSNPTAALDRIEARVASEFGLSYLAGGFVLQVIGYGAEVGGVETATGPYRLLVAVVLAAGAACTAAVGWIALHDRRVQQLGRRVQSEAEAEQARSKAAIEKERAERGEGPLRNG